MATILEALQNAEHNLNGKKPIYLAVKLGKQQLHNAVVLLNKGFELDTDIEDVFEASGTEVVEDVKSAEDFFSC